MSEPAVPSSRAASTGEVDALRRRVEELEQQLAQSQKLQAIGSLAGGVAHDFNNLLTAILGYVSLLREDAGSLQSVSEALDVIEKAADRASQLTSQLLGFARVSQSKRLRVDLHQILRDVAELLRHTIDRKIRLETHFEALTPHVMADPSQMFQIFLNLALNARDSMPNGGVLTLATSPATGSVRASVIDTGTGIPATIRDRIFDPFFTTKDPGKGTGMGLTVVQTIVRGHAGRIEVEWDPPPGTRFHVWLPLATERMPGVGETPVSVPARGRGSVLVIDDEEVVRQVAARMLKSLGYQAICLGAARDAIDYYARRRRDIDLVLVDLIMPDMDGGAVFRELTQINPKARVVLTSGYSQDAAVDAMIEAGARAFLQKPYRLNQLSEVLTTALL